MTWLFAFIGMVVVDFIWGQYIARITRKEAIPASFLAFWLVLTNALVVVGYTENHWLIIPTALGAVAGTYLSVYLDRSRDR